jgi:hypothetical protein
MQVLPVVAQGRADGRAFQMAGDIAFVDRIAGTGEPAAYELAHPLLQIRESVEAEPIREANDGRGIDVELRGHLIDGGEGHRLRVLDDVFGDALLRLREPIVLMAQLLDYVSGTDYIWIGIRLSFADWHHVFLAAQLRQDDKASGTTDNVAGSQDQQCETLAHDLAQKLVASPPSIPNILNRGRLRSVAIPPTNSILQRWPVSFRVL